MASPFESCGVKRKRDIDVPVVRGPAGQTPQLGVEFLREHFKRLFGEWLSGTIMCPHIYPRDYISPIRELTGAAPVKPMVTQTVRGEEAEEKVFTIVKEYGEREKQTMFVLTKLKFTEFINFFMHSDQTTEEIDQAEIEAEIDFVIEHVNIGIILVEVKAAKSWPKGKKHFSQVNKAAEIIRGLLRKGSDIPVYKVAAFPNIDGHGRSKDDCFILKSLDMSSCEEFSHWMELHFSAKTFSSQEKQDLRTLLYILVGQRTSIGSSRKTIEFSDDVSSRKVSSKNFELITRQECLRQRFESESAKGKARKQKFGNESCLQQQLAILKTADRPGNGALAEELVFLTGEQLCIWKGEPIQVIIGPPGSGKTILLQHRALECARKGGKVIVLVPSPLAKLYKAFFAKQSDKQSICQKVTICAFEDLKTWLIDKSEVRMEYHVFIDDMQLFDSIQVNYLSNFLERKRKSCNDYYYCWIAFDVTQGSFSGLGYLHPVRQRLVVVRFNPFEFNLSKEIKYKTSRLTTVMRSTEEILTFVSDYAKRNDYFYSPREVLATAPETEFSALQESYMKNQHVTIGHRVGGGMVKEHKKDSVKAVFDEIHAQLGRWKQCCGYKGIAVLGENGSLLTSLSLMFRDKDIPVCSVGENEDAGKKDEGAIVIDDGSKVHSYEWPVVVAVTDRSSRSFVNYLIFSRAVLELMVFSVQSTLC